MFTGIVQGFSEVVNIKKNKYYSTYGMKFTSSLLKGLKEGASVANNGCCLTVKHIDKSIVFFDVIQTTLTCTNLSYLKIGDQVNIERSIKFGDEIGGHLVSGHINTTAEICDIKTLKNIKEMSFLIKKKSIMKYILYKGFITVDGISLTVNNTKENQFIINLIPETILRTTLTNKDIGYIVNIEVDYYTRLFIDNTKNIFSNYILKNRKP